MRVTKRLGDAAAFLAFGDYHHDLCINSWESRDGTPEIWWSGSGALVTGFETRDPEQMLADAAVV